MLYTLKQYLSKSPPDKKQANKGLTKDNLYILLKAVS
jgi:hypothetical protein